MDPAAEFERFEVFEDGESIGPAGQCREDVQMVVSGVPGDTSPASNESPRDVVSEIVAPSIDPFQSTSL